MPSPDVIVVGSDTDAGKTTFALLWLSAFVDYSYWKPVETGTSDTDAVRAQSPGSVVFPPVARFAQAVAPPLAAQREGKEVPAARTIAGCVPHAPGPLLIETFGGPLSPLTQNELQIELIRELHRPCFVITTTAIGAIGRALLTVRALQSSGVVVAAVVLLGEPDGFAEEQIAQHAGVPAVGVAAPAAWSAHELRACALAHRTELARLRDRLENACRSAVAPALLERDARQIWHPYTPLRDAPTPLAVVAAEGEILHLADGRRIIDGISSWWTILHGHRQPRLMRALADAAGRIDHVMFAGVTHPYAVDCAELLLKSTPWPGGRVFYSDNGSTAVEVALKMAYQFWCHRGEAHRRLFVGFENSYHGDTFGAMAVGRDPLFFGRFEPLLFRSERAPLHPERLDELLLRCGAETAAVIIEPLVQGAGGMRMHSAATLREIADVCRRHAVLLIADEVMSAGRTGTWWAHTQAGISPDFICTAKTLAGGVLPLAATLAAPEIVAEFDVSDRDKTFFHGHSFTANPLACAVAVENLKMLTEGHWLKHSRRIEGFWRQHTANLKNARVCGTILAVDVGQQGGYLAEVGPLLRQTALEHNVLLRPLGNVLYAMPPLETSDQSLDLILAAMKVATGRALV